MSLVVTLLLRVLVTALAAVSVIGQIAYLDLLYWHRLGWAEGLRGHVQTATIAVVGADAIVAVAAAGLALALAFRPDAARGSRQLAVAVGAWAYLLSFGGIYRLLLPLDEGPLGLVVGGHFLVVECLGLAGLLAFSAAFPSPLTPSDLPPSSDTPAGLLPFRHFRIWLLRPASPWIATVGLATAVLAWTHTAGTALVEAPLNPMMDLARFGTLAAVVINFRASWDAHPTEARGPLNWMVLGMVLVVGSLALLVGGSVLTSVTGWRSPLNWRPLLLGLGLLGLLWGAGMASFHKGGAEAKSLVRRTATWIGLATILLFLAAGLETLFSDTVMARVSLPPGTGTIVAVCLFAWIFGGARRLVELVVDQIGQAGLPEEA